MKTLFKLCFFVAALSITITTKAQVNEKDSLALVDLYYYTNGESWYYRGQWLTGPVTQWNKVYLSEDQKRVISIDGDHNNASGTLPPSFGDLSKLQWFNCSSNYIGGNIPSGLGNLLELQSLSLSRNKFTGNIPPEIGNLLKLQNFNAYQNQLSGSIPPELGKLFNLIYLDLRFNNMSGKIPGELGKLENLKILKLNGNRLHGHIPPPLGRLSNLEILTLNNNGLSGAIPPLIGNLNKLTSLDLSHNRFTFDGMELIATKFPFAIYSPQKEISVHTNNGILSASAGGTLSNNTYKWYKAGSTQSVTIIGDSTFQPAESGKYYVKVTNTIATKLILTSDMVNFVMPLAKNKNVDYAENNMQNTVINKFSLYPNPVKDILHVTTNGSASFSLTNASGKIMLTTTINKSGTINVSRLPAGEYYLTNNNKNVSNKVVVVK